MTPELRYYLLGVVIGTFMGYSIARWWHLRREISETEQAIQDMLGRIRQENEL